ncbi:MAG: hypothetical protein COY42_01835 [Armatimonadetes bacterium CG_4_10_14_0_8_um_filter_66_14]|nr:MAG: hypothetical protein COW34_05670 [Armatimonadetes bacterium CG17_big_fil_post_rev_8_21_14_2_50_66_6]PIZ50304.1 MAG: hypothetical protein COY42_01835 [Armatimonadetes bacterium CG_4_10_14_0_8_um_filter_66_14]
MDGPLMASGRTPALARWATLAIVLTLGTIRSGRAQPPATNSGAGFKRAQTDMDRSSAYLVTSLAAMTQQLKELAAKAQVAGQKEQLEKQLGELYEPHNAAVTMLLVQTYLAAVERALADGGLEAQAIDRVVTVWGLTKTDVLAQREKGINWSSILLSQALGKVADKPTADLLALYEKGQSWSEIAASFPVKAETLGGEIEKVFKE